MHSLFNDLDSLRDLLDQLLLRGVSGAGSAELQGLERMETGFAELATVHLAAHVASLRQALAEGRQDAGSIVLDLRDRLDVFERALTLDVVKANFFSEHAS